MTAFPLRSLGVELYTESITYLTETARVLNTLCFRCHATDRAHPRTRWSFVRPMPHSIRSRVLTMMSHRLQRHIACVSVCFQLSSTTLAPRATLPRRTPLSDEPPHIVNHRGTNKTPRSYTTKVMLRGLMAPPSHLVIQCSSNPLSTCRCFHHQMLTIIKYCSTDGTCRLCVIVGK